jgi:hypothetical protein
MVLRRQKGRHITPHRSQSQAAKPSHHQTCRSNPLYGPDRRAFRRPRLRRYARPLRRIRRVWPRRNLQRPHHLPVPLRNAPTHHPPNGMDKLSTDISRRRHLYPTARNSRYDDPLYKEASHRPVFFIYFFVHMSITYSPLFWCYVFVYSPCPDYYIV